MSKIERLAGMPGKPETEMGYGDDWYVVQHTGVPMTGQVYGPIRKGEQSAIRSWNAMVRRIRKANAGEIDR